MAKSVVADYERFFRNIKKQKNGCWIWRLAPDKDGYGLFSIGSVTNGTAKRVRAARWAYQMFIGPT